MHSLHLKKPLTARNKTKQNKTKQNKTKQNKTKQQNNSTADSSRLNGPHTDNVKVKQEGTYKLLSYWGGRGMSKYSLGNISIGLKRPEPKGQIMWLTCILETELREP